MIRFLVASLGLLATPAQMVQQVSVSSDSQTFSEAWLQARAQRLSQSAYVASTGSLPGPLAAMSYDQHRDIRFRPEASVWRNLKLPFEMQLFHLGHLFKEPVAIHVIERGRINRLRYSPNLFNFGATKLSEPLPDSLGFAGFRIHHPLNRKDYYDELLAFLGASYFRALGRGNAYGLSARGLAIDTATPGGEIFPVFREFYLEKPSKEGRRLVIHALLDSPNTTGAYRFEITPGENTEIKVTATLYPRRGAERLGLAPLTSMYLFGENDRGGFDDYRPEVHDSDGLQVWFGNGERLWRPLQNPKRLEVSVLRADSLKGFGLSQRDRRASHYEDLESSYERRPSVWIEPGEGFGAGNVFLIEIPSREEIHDNVVAFFNPDAKLTPGTPLRFTYRMLWGMAPVPTTNAATVSATREGSGLQVGVPLEQQKINASARKFVIDFTSPNPPVAGDVEAVVSVAGGTTKNTRVLSLPEGGYRVVFDFVPPSSESTELRCFLRQKEAALSETWSYRFSRQEEGK